MTIENLDFENIAVIGSTRLTYKLLTVLEKIQRPKVVFGLPNALVSHKANAIHLDDFCMAKGILLDKSNDWHSFHQYCEQFGVNIILRFGDSRIIPLFLSKRYQVISNHGGILPDVQGAASLIWGRLLNQGQWGVSLFEINERIDVGDIVATNSFDYERNMPMSAFVEVADTLTLQLFMTIVKQGFIRQKNQSWHLKVAKRTDAYMTVELLRTALQLQANIYLPPRTPVESRLNPTWPAEFQRTFQLAVDNPYPRWHD